MTSLSIFDQKLAGDPQGAAEASVMAVVALIEMTAPSQWMHFATKLGRIGEWEMAKDVVECSVMSEV